MMDNEKSVKSTDECLCENQVGVVNLQKMTGSDKRIENYERMVGNLFVGQMMSPQKVASNIGNRPIYQPRLNFKS